MTDLTKNSFDQVLDLINFSNSSDLTVGLVSFSNPTALTEDTKDTSIRVNPLPNTPYIGYVDVKYNRLDVEGFATNYGASNIVVSDPSTFNNIVIAFNSHYGSNLSSIDDLVEPETLPTIEFEPVNVDLVANANSLAYKGQGTYTFSLPTSLLSDIIQILNLPGLNFPGSQGEIPGEGGTLIGLGDWEEHGLVPDPLPGYEDTFWFEYGGISSKVGNALKISYPDTTNDGYVNGGEAFFVDGLNLQEIYIEFLAYIPTANRSACKFLKIGGVGGTGYANTTYQLESNGLFDHISFGDGTSTENDAQQVIYYDGSNPTFTGRNYGEANISLPAGEAFVLPASSTVPHRFRIKHRYNSGTSAETEIPDGEYYVEVDGVVYCHATGLFNRHWQNSLFIEQINLGGVVQNSLPFDVVFDTVKFSVGGFISE